MGLNRLHRKLDNYIVLDLGAGISYSRAAPFSEWLNQQAANHGPRHGRQPQLLASSNRGWQTREARAAPLREAL